MMRSACLGLVVVAGGLAQVACFELVLPEGAQITCAVDAPRCPPGLQCCAGLCRLQCACPGGAEPCGLNGAVDCAGLRQCADHCWADCPGCAERCDNPQLRTCQADEFDEVWFCAGDDVCVVKHGPAGTTPTAACHRPPPQCADPGDQVCACLQAPFSISPPCTPFEQCTDYARPCVACRQEASTGVDAGMPDHTVVPVDTGVQDVAPSPADAAAGTPDGAVVGIDVAGDSDAAAVEPPMRLSDVGPECYALNDAGTLCCELVDAPASFSDLSGSYDCAGSDLLATECTGFDQSCAADPSLCNTANTCRWAYCYGEMVRCAEDGPPAPCDGTAWVCPAGSVVLSRCGGLCTS